MIVLFSQNPQAALRLETDSESTSIGCYPWVCFSAPGGDFTLRLGHLIPATGILGLDMEGQGYRGSPGFHVVRFSCLVSTCLFSDRSPLVGLLGLLRLLVRVSKNGCAIQATADEVTCCPGQVST